MAVQMDHGVTSGMTYNYLYFVIILDPPPQEEAQPHLHTMQCMYSHVSLRHMCDLVPASTQDDKAPLSRYSS